LCPVHIYFRDVAFSIPEQAFFPTERHFQRYFRHFAKKFFLVVIPDFICPDGEKPLIVWLICIAGATGFFFASLRSFASFGLRLKASSDAVREAKSMNAWLPTTQMDD
jgi:hypothetical protein